MFFTYLRRELRRRRKASLVVAVGLGLGIALVIVVASVSTGMQKAQGSVLQSLYGLGTDMTVTKAATAPDSGSGNDRRRFNFKARDEGDDSRQSSDRVMVQGFQTLSEATVAKVADQKGVAQAVGGLRLQVLKIDGQFQRGQWQQRSGGQQGGGYGGRTGGQGGAPQGEVTGGGAQFDVNNYSLYGVDTEHLGLGPMTTSKITSGKGFTTKDADAKKVVVDSSYAKQQKLKVGSSLTVSGTKFAVVGIATADSGDASADVYMPLAPAQKLADSARKVTTVYVRATDSQSIDAVKSAVQKHVSGTTVTTSADLADTVSGSLSTAASLATNVGKWLSIAVLVAAFLVAGLLTSSAVSRRVREFGTLKALGWRSSRVTGQVVGEAVVNGLLGGVLGIVLGIAAAYVVTAIGPTLSASLGGTAQAGGGPGGPGGGMGRGGAGGGFGGAGRAAQHTLDVVLSAPVSVSVVLLAVGLAVAGGLVAGGFGAWRASRLRPADALARVA
ncbi:ABC transporter permease [Streptomyces sp. NPDC059740]|uniref:ABC transporter permease n=1 Tax=Streptomyces sp. NPDC059740 TaxID=3346926 RepID=UPI003667C381